MCHAQKNSEIIKTSAKNSSLLKTKKSGDINTMENNKAILKKAPRRLLDFLLGVREMGVLIPIILAVIIFSSSNQFLTSENIVNILRNTSFVFITAVGMTFLIVSGAFDLSVGAVYAFAGVFCGKLMMDVGVSIPIAIIVATLGSGIIFGSINGFFVQKVGLPPILATLASMNIARGVVLTVQMGNPVYPLPEAFEQIGQGSFFKNTMFEIPYVVAIAVVIGIIAIFVLRKTTYGRMVCAVGGNRETARLAGIPTKLVGFSVYIMVSSLAALSGILISSRLGSAQPNVGVGYELSTIAAVVIGGTSLLGGAGTIIGTALGALFMTMIPNGMILLRLSPFWQPTVLGVVLLIACSMDYVRNHLKK